MLHLKNVDTTHMYAARKIARKTSEKTLNLKGEMYFATETSLALLMRFTKRIGARCSANDGGFCSNFELTGVFSRGREIGIRGIGLTKSMARWESPEVGSTRSAF